ncbi:rhodanese domain-containing protein CG4456-like [Prorops nasuta]|uniref:rhodanese domain-containing protein CG4456-like n=1 Tax=Prorops nasuta TaxID=863751 RepID=UPI0034CD77AF
MYFRSYNIYNKLTPSYRSFAHTYLSRSQMSNTHSLLTNFYNITPCKNQKLTILYQSQQTSPFSDSITILSSANKMNDNLSTLKISYDELLEAQKNDNILIVDVREQEEIDQTGKLPGSIHIPMGDVANYFTNSSEKSFKERFNKLKPNHDTKVILSCKSGKRSGMVQQELQKLGYKNIYNFTGGWMEWESKQK